MSETHTFFATKIAAYSSEPGGTVTLIDDDGNTVLLPAGVVSNFEDIGDRMQHDQEIIRVGVLNSFVERHGTLSDKFAKA